MEKKPLHLRPWPYAVAALLAVALFLSTAIDLRRGDPRPRGSAEDVAALATRDDVNVLFIMIDTLRADRLSAYGYERETSPLIDHLAGHGVRFARHLAQSSWTKASMASLWTGLHPNRAGVTRFNDLLSPEAVMPAERLREAGFRTAGIWRNGWVAGYFGFDQGFEVYDRPISRPPPPEVRMQNPTMKMVGTDMDAILAAEDFLRVYKNERWFLYLHLMDIHEYTYDEDSARFGTSFSDIYDNSILRTDMELRRLFDFLAAQGQLGKTLIVLTSDHGEAFMERGFEGHARKVYRETTEVPLILGFPFTLDEEVVIESRTQGVDLWPTVLDLVGIDFAPGQTLDGRSRVPELMAALRGEEIESAGGPSLAHLDQTWGQRDIASRPTVAVSDGPLRYVQSAEPTGVLLEELFDASIDSAELVNLAEDRPEDLARLRAVAEAYLKLAPVWGEATKKLDLDEIQLNQLRALGYSLP
jgi:arylsulfatase A-like enzyme